MRPVGSGPENVGKCQPETSDKIPQQTLFELRDRCRILERKSKKFVIPRGISLGAGWALALSVQPPLVEST
jgi:hypothetical protein